MVEGLGLGLMFLCILGPLVWLLDRDAQREHEKDMADKRSKK